MRKDIALAEKILANLKREVGADLAPILRDGSLSVQERRSRAADLLFQALSARGRAEHPAEWEGAAFAAAAVEVEPNIVVSVKEARRLEALQGEPVKTYMYDLTERMEQMARASTPEDLARQLVLAGLLSVGTSMAKGTIVALRAGQALFTAVRIGIMGIGMSTAIGTVVVLLVGLLLWLMLENPKKVLGLVLNDTDANLVVDNWRSGVDGGTGSNLFMKHGHMQSFMADYEGGNLNKVIQINARAYFGPDDPDNAVYGGIYFADKNAGFRGAEGTMVFTSSNAPRFAHCFAVPYTKDNGTNMAVNMGGSPESINQQLYDSRRVRVSFISAGYRMTATVNDPRGGVVGCIAAIVKV